MNHELVPNRSSVIPSSLGTRRKNALTIDPVLADSVSDEHHQPLGRNPSANTYPPHKYKHLNDLQIRLLAIEPAERPSDPIVCHTYTDSSAFVTTEPRRQYVALSYSWGQTYRDGSHLNRSIICDSQCLRVTSHLYAALLRIRQAWDEGYITYHADWPLIPERHTEWGIRPYLWVDAICINQRDTEERSRQVTRMSDIYNRAMEVYVWLGDNSEGVPGMFERSIEGWIADRNLFTSLLNSQHLESFDKTVKNSLERILMRSWFKRRWVIQEYESHTTHNPPYPNASEFLLGKSVISAKDFNKLLHTYSLQQSAGPLQTTSFIGKHRRLLYQLYMHDKAACSDGRDRVYALMSLTNDCKWLKIDYSLSSAAVYTALAKGAVERYRERPSHLIPILVSASARRLVGAINSLELPSWIPDWRNEMNFRCPEHQKAVQTSFDRSLEGVSDIRPSIRNDRYLYLHGRTLQPCFPSQDRQHCLTCSIFADIWDSWSDELKTQLQQAKRNSYILLILTKFGLAFVLSPQVMVGRKRTYRLEFSFSFFYWVKKVLDKREEVCIV